MKVVLAVLAVALSVMFVAPGSNALDVPKLQGFTSMVEPIKAKRSQSPKSKVDRCIAACQKDCWFNCDDGCRCLCVGMKKGEFCIGPA